MVSSVVCPGVQVQHLIFDQTRFELSDPLYRHPLWESFREGVSRPSSDRQSTRKRHRTSSDRRSRVAKKSEGEEAHAAPQANSVRRATENRAASAAGASSSSSCTNEAAQSSASSSVTSSRQPSSEPGDPPPPVKASRSQTSHSRRKEKPGHSPAGAPGGDEQAGEPTGRSAAEEEGPDVVGPGTGGEGQEDERERTDQEALAVAMKDVERILGDGAPPWVAWVDKGQ